MRGLRSQSFILNCVAILDSFHCSSDFLLLTVLILVRWERGTCYGLFYWFVFSLFSLFSPFCSRTGKISSSFTFGHCKKCKWNQLFIKKYTKYTLNIFHTVCFYSLTPLIRNWLSNVRVILFYILLPMGNPAHTKKVSNVPECSGSTRIFWTVIERKFS